MVWHILKKDLRLLWPVLLAANGLLWAMALALVLARRWNSPSLYSMLNVLEPLAYLGIAFLIALVIQQEPIPGVRQDWLVRPIKRRDLLLAKLVFVVLMIHGSILAADVFQGMANGFPFGQSLAPALARNICVLVFMTLPLVALASFTRTLAETTVGIVLAMLAASGFQILVSGLLSKGPGPGKMFDPISFTGVEWVGQWLRMIVFLLGAGLVLGLQYFRRKTIASRWLTGCIAGLIFLTQLLPWRLAFAVQQRFSPSPGAGQAVKIAYDPALGRARRPPGLDKLDFVDRIRAAQGSAIVLVPMHITGLPDDSVLRADRTEIRITRADGKVLDLDGRDDIRLLKEGRSDGEGRVHPEIRMQREQYEQLKNQMVRLEIEYSLTLFRLSDTHALPAIGGDQQFPGGTRCTTIIDDEQDDVVFRCIEPGHRFGCSTVFLEHAPSGRRNPEAFFCGADYARFSFTIAPDMIGGGRVGLAFRDLNGLAHYPVDAGQLAQSQVVLRNYTPVDHFTRRLVIPQIKLSEWEPQ
jgi:hypothetical protein